MDDLAAAVPVYRPLSWGGVRPDRGPSVLLGHFRGAHTRLPPSQALRYIVIMRVWSFMRVWSLALVALVACGTDGTDFVFELPSNFPAPRVPDDNPMSEVKVELGRRLFYDVRLSGNETQSCGSCHVQALAFTDGAEVSTGSTGEMTPRGSMSLANIGYAASLTWANPTLRALEDQALVPMFGESPIELGLAGREDELLQRLRDEPIYQDLFARAFRDDEPVTVANVVRAIGAFQRTLISGNSPYDRFLRGDDDAISESARRGGDLFFGEEVECFHCHGGFLFSSAIDHAGNVFDQSSFQNNGLYNVDGRGAYPASNPGLYEFTEDRADHGKFKPPTLRNIAVTAPYMHDGSIQTLEGVLEHYAAGGRNVSDGEHLGDGRESPNKSLFVNGFELTEERRADLLAFLESLTDESFLTNPEFSDPW